MKKLGIMVVALVAAAAVHADILAAWDMTGLPASQSSAPVTTVDADMSSSDLTQGPRLTSTPGWPDALASHGESWRMGPDIWNSVALGSYYSFTLTPDAGKTVSYDSVDARLAVNAGGADTDITFHLLSSQTGFTGNDALDSINILMPDPGDFVPAIYGATFDLSAAGLTGISTATEFRIYVSVASGGNRNGIGHTWSGMSDPDDLIVNGTVIPEPATLGLLVFVSGGMFWFRRRFRI